MDIRRPDLWFWCVRPHLNRLYGVGQDWTRRFVLSTRRVGDHCAPNPSCEWVNDRKEVPWGLRCEKGPGSLGTQRVGPRSRRESTCAPQIVQTLHDIEVSYLPVGVGLRPQCWPTKKGYFYDNGLCDNYLVVGGEIVPSYRLKDTDADYRLKDTNECYRLKDTDDIVWYVWKDKELKDFLWVYATATTVRHFEKALEELKKFNAEAHDWLIQILPAHWARSHFSG
uniref:Uncharacterized protein n=1 Tax=Lactuca sativa TaxID=4236 RepID=A0A9R1X1S0_LACSA|nr:hypothetical protein LSAT_V11C700371470 [Lactuca sativa]